MSSQSAAKMTKRQTRERERRQAKRTKNYRAEHRKKFHCGLKPGRFETPNPTIKCPSTYVWILGCTAVWITSLSLKNPSKWRLVSRQYPEFSYWYPDQYPNIKNQLHTVKEIWKSSRNRGKCQQAISYKKKIMTITRFCNKYLFKKFQTLWGPLCEPLGPSGAPKAWGHRHTCDLRNPCHQACLVSR